MEEKREKYIAPRLTVVTIKSERGYAFSLANAVMLWSLSGDPQMEQYQERDNWTSESSSFWI